MMKTWMMRSLGAEDEKLWFNANLSVSELIATTVATELIHNPWTSLTYCIRESSFIVILNALSGSWRSS